MSTGTRVDTPSAPASCAGELAALGRFAAELTARQLPPAVVEKAKACLLYAMAVGIASLGSRQAAHAASIGRSGKTDGGSRRFFDLGTAGAAQAALANGTLFHARVQDDAHPAGHVGVVVVPTALAMAEATGANGEALLAALVAGYEVSLRIGRDHAAHSSERGFRTTPIYGVFGAAATAGRLLGLDASRLTHALALAANMAGGLREFSESGAEDYAFQAGIAASNGIFAAQLAEAGATSSMSALGGKAGFFRAYGRGDVDYGRRLAEGLGQSFEITAVTYKPYPICQFHRGIVIGAATLGERANRAEFAALVIRMHPFEADFYGVRFAGPFKTFPQAFMSAPLCAALGWSRGNATYAALTSGGDEDVRRLVGRVSIVADDSRARYSPHVEARLADGTRLEWQESRQVGSYDLTWGAAVDMAGRLASEAGVPIQHAERLASAIAGLEGAATIAPVIDVMAEACRAARATFTKSYPSSE